MTAPVAYARRVIGIVHPGQMGAAVGKVLVDAGNQVAWASAGRSADTRSRAEKAGLTDLSTTAAIAAECEIVLSICPPHAALDTVAVFGGYEGLYADLNAVAPETAARVGEQVARFVDGGIVGPPPLTAGTTRLYLSGGEAAGLAGLFAGTALDARVVGPGTQASALKMVYAAWTKGTTALLLGIGATARALGVEDELVAEWELSQPSLSERSAQSARTGFERGWRWSFELEEIGRTFTTAGLPGGFGFAAAEIFDRIAREDDLETALRRLGSPGNTNS